MGNPIDIFALTFDPKGQPSWNGADYSSGRLTARLAQLRVSRSRSFTTGRSSAFVWRDRAIGSAGGARVARRGPGRCR